MDSENTQHTRVNGKVIAQTILTRVHDRVQTLERTPHLVVVSVGATPATESYLAIKQRAAHVAGITFTYHALAQGVTLLEVQETIQQILAADNDRHATALVLQLPLPKHLATDTLLAAISESCDADVLNPQTYTRFANGELGALVPPVAAAVAAILEQHAVSPVEKSVVVVGAGKLVGAPVAAWFSQHGANVTVLDEYTFTTGGAVLAAADIVVSGTGHAGLIQPHMVKKGVVLIDAGTSESHGRIVGDTDPACVEVASVYSGVPGGVGPVAVACLMQNVLELALRKESE